MFSPYGDNKAAQTVVDVLSDPLINQLKLPLFVKPLFRTNINPNMYALVRKAIQAGKITVGLRPNMNASAEYTDGEIPVPAKKAKVLFYDSMLLKRPTLRKDPKQQTVDKINILHESTHAGFDLLKTKDMTKMDHEMGAYIAGGLFGVLLVVKNGFNPRNTTMKKSTVTDASWQCGIHLYENRDSKSTFITPAWLGLITYLAATIHAAPPYTRQKMYEEVDNDGVGKPWTTEPMK